MASANRAEWLDKVYNAKNYEELAEGYDLWAEEYDNDLMSFGYKMPAIMTGYAGRHLEPDAGPILDAGVGTGIAGELLNVLGYSDLVGIDLSQGMLDVAAKKEIYDSLHQMILGEPLGFEDDQFAATVSIGTFTKGHAPASGFDELIRVTKPGGKILFGVRADLYAEGGFKEKQEGLEEAGRWQLVEMTDPFQTLPLGEPEVFNQIFVYTVC